jgi:hypothetical protein
VLASFDCWKKQAADCKLAADGALELHLFLKDLSPAVMDQLKSLGFQPRGIRPKEKAVIGRVPFDKLTELARMETITFISSVRR